MLGFLQGADRNWLLAAIVLMLLGGSLVPLVFLPQRRRIEAAPRWPCCRIASRRSLGLRPMIVQWILALIEEFAVVVIVLLMALRPF